MKSVKTIILILLLLILILGLTSFVFAYNQNKRYDFNTHEIVDVSTKYKTKDINLKLKENDIIKEYPIKCYMTISPSESIKNILYDSGSFNREVTTDLQVVKEAVLQFTKLTPRHEFHKAYITESCDFVPTEYSNTIDLVKLENDLNDFPKTKSFDITDYYIEETDDTAEELQELVDTLNSCKIEYTNGDVIQAVNLEPHYNVSNNTISFNNALIEEAVKDITLSYDNVGKDSFNFNSTNHGPITVKSGTWGMITDTEEETIQVIDLINSLSSNTNRIPVCKQEMQSELPDTYIEVDKDNQHVYVYENGTLVMDTDCVTGLPPKRTTPTGVYFISEQQKNKTLRGPGYSSFVNRWMRLTNSGVGLHDATWRSRFGGDIYLHDGSHGCINLPKQFAYDLYDWASNKKNVCVVVF